MNTCYSRHYSVLFCFFLVGLLVLSFDGYPVLISVHVRNGASSGIGGFVWHCIRVSDTEVHGVHGYSRVRSFGFHA